MNTKLLDQHLLMLTQKCNQLEAKLYSGHHMPPDAVVHTVKEIEKYAHAFAFISQIKQAREDAAKQEKVDSTPVKVELKAVPQDEKAQSDMASAE